MEKEYENSWSLKVFWERQELKDYLESRKKEAPKVKNEITANSKNELTSWPQIKSNLDHWKIKKAMETIEPLIKEMRAINTQLMNLWDMMPESKKNELRMSWKKKRQQAVDALFEAGRENRNAIIFRISDIDSWMWFDFDQYIILDEEEPKNEITSKRPLK